MTQHDVAPSTSGRGDKFIPFYILGIILVHNLSLDLLLQQVLQRHRIRRKLRDTLAQLLRRHGILVQQEPEQRLVVEVRHLGDVQLGRVLAGQLLGHRRRRVVHFLQQVRRDGQVVASRQLSNLSRVTERRTHDDRLVAVLLVVVEDVLHRLHTGVLLSAVLLLVRRLVPVKDTAHERRDQECAGLSTRDGLHRREHQGQVAVDLVLVLQDVRRLDTFPGGGDLDQDTVPGDTLRLVELQN